jgi:hypothetical protein
MGEAKTMVFEALALIARTTAAVVGAGRRPGGGGWGRCFIEYFDALEIGFADFDEMRRELALDADRDRSAALRGESIMARRAGLTVAHDDSRLAVVAHPSAEEVQGVHEASFDGVAVFLEIFARLCESRFDKIDAADRLTDQTGKQPWPAAELAA